MTGDVNEPEKDIITSLFVRFFFSIKINNLQSRLVILLIINDNLKS